MIFFFLFLLGNVLLTTSGNVEDLGKSLEHSHTMKTRHGKTFPLRVSFVYEKSNVGEKWKMAKNTIKDAAKIASEVFKSLNVKIILENAEEIKHERLFRMMRKSTDVLKVFLKYKQSLINSRHSDNLQLITTKHLGLDHKLVGLATFRTVCSPESLGVIVIKKDWETSHLAVMMAHNLACIIGISTKFCYDGYKEDDIKCHSKRKALTTKEITACILNEINVDLKYYNLKAICEENRAVKSILKKKQRANKDEKQSKLLIVVTVTGVVLLIIVVAVVYKMKKNYEKGRILKDRIHMEYNYEVATARNTRPSVINDPTVTNDLQR